MSDLGAMKAAVNAELATAARLESIKVGDLPVSEHETMHTNNRAVYDALGKSAAHLVACAASVVSVEIRSILDFPCGHGRVMRAFRATWPDVELFACDIDEPGVRFCVDTFDATAIPSSLDLSNVHVPEQVDVVWVGSLLTHLDQDQWDSVFDFCLRSIKENGLAVLTYAGPYVAELIRAGDHGGVEIADAKRCVDNFDAHGFGFMHYPRKDGRKYGRSVASYNWVSSYISESHNQARPVLHVERGWGGRQSALAIQKDAVFADVRR